MTSSSTLVIGCSEQLPNELRAYRVMGTSTEGAVLLSRHGATYSAAASEVSAYPELLERMLGVVLPSFPSSLRARARPALIKRWNRDWGVEADDLGRADSRVRERQRGGSGDRVARNFHLALRGFAAHD